MKKTVIRCIEALFVFALLSAFVINLFIDQGDDILSLNVEALVRSETPTTCTATANCLLGDKILGSVSCTGTRCISGYGYVECDGVKSECENNIAL
ncbi:MAG: hypothetical protein IJS07_08840 [Bacteroidales bacterium]|nr:hypothetical protein [Bacteroidales bacterium]